MSELNKLQQQSVLSSCLAVHEQLADIEVLLAAERRRSPFSRHVPDPSSVARRVTRDYFHKVREAIVDVLEDNGIPIRPDSVSMRWATSTGPCFGWVMVALGVPRPARSKAASPTEAMVATASEK